MKMQSAQSSRPLLPKRSRRGFKKWLPTLVQSIKALGVHGFWYANITQRVHDYLIVYQQVFDEECNLFVKDQIEIQSNAPNEGFAHI